MHLVDFGSGVDVCEGQLEVGLEAEHEGREEDEVVAVADYLRGREGQQKEEQGQIYHF